VVPTSDSGAGQYVEFTLARPANAVDLRYSIPDSADGTGLTTPLKPPDAFGFVGDYIPNATPPAYAITNVHIDGAIVHNVGTFVFQLQSAGSVTVSHVIATGVGLDGQMACAYGITVIDPPVSYLRLDISNNTAQGAPQLAEFEAFSS
jgi:hypothetical protein